MSRALKPGGRLVAELGGQGNIRTIVNAIRRCITDAGYGTPTPRSPWYFPDIPSYTGLLKAAWPEYHHGHSVPATHPPVRRPRGHGTLARHVSPAPSLRKSRLKHAQRSSMRSWKSCSPASTTEISGWQTTSDCASLRPKPLVARRGYAITCSPLGTEHCSFPWLDPNPRRIPVLPHPTVGALREAPVPARAGPPPPPEPPPPPTPPIVVPAEAGIQGRGAAQGRHRAAHPHYKPIRRHSRFRPP